MEHKKLEKAIGYVFKDKSLLDMALRHSSYINEHHMKRIQCNERLEFLGDAVLEMVSSEFFYFTYPDLPEGKLTQMRASSVCEQALAITARDLSLGSYMLLGKGEELTGGRDRDSIIADGVEAIIGSIYLDGGLAPAKDFILTHVLNDLEKKQLFYDAKSILQEKVQIGHLGNLSYKLIAEDGPDHAKHFAVEAWLDDTRIGSGEGHSKKLAEQHAAYQALLQMQAQETN